MKAPNSGPMPQEAEAAPPALQECPACGSSLFTSRGEVKDLNFGLTTDRFPLVECGSCGTLRTVLSSKQLDRIQTYYPEPSGNPGEVLSPARWKTWDKIHGWEIRATGDREASKLVDPSAIAEPGHGRIAVDVGTGRGRLVEALSGLGWVALGVEPGAGTASNTESNRPNIMHETWEKIEIAPRKVDRIYFVHSLEHVPNPYAALMKARSLIADGGMVVVAIPDIRSREALFFGTAWYSLDVPRHITHFTQAGIRVLANRCNLRLDKIYYLNGLEGVLLSLRNAVRMRRGGNVKAVFSSPVELRRSRVIYRVITLAANLTLGPMCLLLRVPTRRYIVCVLLPDISIGPRSTPN
jgi:hypothetical protein